MGELGVCETFASHSSSSDFLPRFCTARTLSMSGANARATAWCTRRVRPSYSTDAQLGPGQMSLSCQQRIPIVCTVGSLLLIRQWVKAVS